VSGARPYAATGRSLPPEMRSFRKNARIFGGQFHPPAASLRSGRGAAALMPAPRPGGTIRGEGEQFQQRGVFLPRVAVTLRCRPLTPCEGTTSLAAQPERPARDHDSGCLYFGRPHRKPKNWLALAGPSVASRAKTPEPVPWLKSPPRRSAAGNPTLLSKASSTSAMASPP
jgi:hypothetical protein